MSILILRSPAKDELQYVLSQLTYSAEGLKEIGSGATCAVIVATSETEFSNRSKILQDQLRSQEEVFLLDQGVFFTSRQIDKENICFIFPGQGSQSPSLLKKLGDHKVYREEFQKNLDYLKSQGRDLSLALNSSELLDRTENAQPALAACELAALALLRSYGIEAGRFAGHSFGELVAIAAAQGFAPEVLLDLSIARGSFMAQANNLAPGRMLAVVERERDQWHTFHEHLKNLGLVTDELLANINTHSQLIYSGSESQMKELREGCQKHNIKSTFLSASAAFHSPLMKPAEKLFATFMQKYKSQFLTPKAEIISTIPGCSYQKAQDIADNLSCQLSAQVNWVNCIETLIQQGTKLFVEVGPKFTLTKMIKDIHPESDILVFPLDGAYPFEHLLGLFAVLNYPLSPPKGHEIKWDITTRNKIIRGFLEKQKDLFSELQVIKDENYRNEVEKKILADTEEVLGQYFAVENLMQESPIEETKTEVGDKVTTIILEEISRVTGFHLSEIKIDARFDNELYLDSITRIEILSQLSASFKTEMTDMTALLNANSVRELATIINKYSASPPEELLSEELVWVRKEIANYTGIAIDKINLKTRFNEELMLDSLIKMDLLGSLQAHFPKLLVDLKSFHLVNSLEDLASSLIAQKVPDLESIGKERRFAKVVREGLAQYLGLRVDRVLTTSNFEMDLKMNIFEKEDFINSLLLKFPYLQLASRELLHTSTVGDLIQIDELFDRRTTGRTSEEEIVRYKFKKLEIDRTDLTQSGFAKNILVIQVNSKDNHAPIVEFIKSKTPESEIELLKDLAKNELSTTLKRFTTNQHLDILLLISQRSETKDWELNLEEYIERTYLFTKSLEVVTKHFKNVNVKILIHGALNPFTRGLVGLTRSLAKEFSIFVNIVDMPWQKASPASLPWFLLWDKLELRKEKCRYYKLEDKHFVSEVLQAETHPAATTTLHLTEKEHILLIGGARGIASEIAKFLAEEKQASITAIGRTPMGNALPYSECESDHELREKVKADIFKTNPQASAEERTIIFNAHLISINNQREIWKTKEAIENRGGEFHYYQADATNFQELEALIKKIELELGPIRGVIHAAGITRDSLVKNKTLQDFREVIQTKVKSALNLYKIFHRRDDLAFVCYFSSLSSWSGAPGQTDYSLANEILNVLADNWSRKAKFPVSSLLWSVWHETGLASEGLIQQMHTLKLAGISNRAGIRLFKEELFKHGLKDSKVLFTPESTLRYGLEGTHE
jgi:malonyl CoA-acyl carrier protein transacylase/NAD(P)-dependent dehydrogenase (short-subunit alcohol dehydrogenase family)/acyl carrier protein